MGELEFSFKASLPDIQSAIKIGADSARIQLDVPASELPAAVNLIYLSGFVLNVKITVEPQDGS